jgi:nucleoside-diphosphate-sugar epimerase
MLEAARLQKVEKFLLMSSIDVYYPTSYVFLKEENDFSTKMNQTIEGYAWAKRFAELAAKMYYKQYGLQVAIARAGNVYGPRDELSTERGRVIPTFISRSFQGEDVTIFGDGQQKKSFIFVEDLITALVSLTEKYAVADPVNIAGKKYITIRELAELVIKYTGSKNNVTFNKTVSPPAKQTKVHLGKMKKILGSKENVSLRKGLKMTIAYYTNTK